jgi:hypothetical protein
MQHNDAKVQKVRIKLVAVKLCCRSNRLRTTNKGKIVYDEDTELFDKQGPSSWTERPSAAEGIF